MPPVIRTLVALLGILLVVGSLAVACGDDDGDNDGDGTAASGATPASGGAEPTATEREVCGALDDFRSSITTLAQSSNEDELKDNADTARERAQDLRESLSDARVESREQLDDSLDEFTSAIDDASSGDRPFAGTIAAVAEAIVKVQDQLTNVRAEGGCD
jgi:hypothetical protein